MSAAIRILIAVSFSMLATLIAMYLLSQLPGMDVPLQWWIFGAACPLVVSFPVSYLLIRQGDRNQMLHTELRAAFAQAKPLSEIDQMTGLLNRATFIRWASERSKASFGAVLLIDIDNFKSINDLYGHHVGDTVLQMVAETLKSSTRSTDLCGRLGGEEFAVLLQNCDIDTALNMAERLRVNVSELQIALPNKQVVAPTISIGVATQNGVHPFQETLQHADRAMYRAKNQGRNQVQLAA